MIMDPKLSEKVEEEWFWCDVCTGSWEGRALGSQQAELSLGVTRSRQSVGVGAEVEWNGREQERESRVWGDSSTWELGPPRMLAGDVVQR